MINPLTTLQRLEEEAKGEEVEEKRDWISLASVENQQKCQETSRKAANLYPHELNNFFKEITKTLSIALV